MISGPPIVLRLPPTMRDAAMRADAELADDAQTHACNTKDIEASELLYHLCANLAFKQQLADGAVRKMTAATLDAHRVRRAADAALTDLQSLANLCDDAPVLEIIQHAAKLLMDALGASPQDGRN